jgi:hypothetical protein
MSLVDDMLTLRRTVALIEENRVELTEAMHRLYDAPAMATTAQSINLLMLLLGTLAGKLAKDVDEAQ